MTDGIRWYYIDIRLPLFFKYEGGGGGQIDPSPRENYSHKSPALLGLMNCFGFLSLFSN